MPSVPPGAEASAAIDEAAQDWFLRLSSGTASAAERHAFVQWRDRDPRHAAAYGEIEELWNDLGPLEAAFAPNGRAVSPIPPSRTDMAVPARWSWWRRPIWTGGVAALCLTILVAVAFGPLPQTMLADHSTAIGHRAMIALPDGTIAHLNTDTAIDLAYDPDHRRIRLLRGEAFFEVHKDAARPFEVAAAGGRAIAIGTAFAVRDVGHAAVVTVTEGVVRVESPSPGNGTRPVKVQAGQQVRYESGASPGPVHDQDSASETAWLRGQIVIHDRPLGDALAEIERYQHGKIILLHDGADLQPVTARVALDDLDGGIDALAATHGLSVIRLTPFLAILR